MLTSLAGGLGSSGLALLFGDVSSRWLSPGRGELVALLALGFDVLLAAVIAVLVLGFTGPVRSAGGRGRRR